MAQVADFIVWFAKSRENLKTRALFFDKQDAGQSGDYRFSRDESGEIFSGKLAVHEEKVALTATTSQRPMQGNDLKSFAYRGKSISPGVGTFKTDFRGLSRLALAGRLFARVNSLRYIRSLNEL